MSTPAAAPQQRMTVAELLDRIQPLIGTSQKVEKTKNKGAAGIALERALGIPQTSACLDCADGELKAFPLKRLASGRLVPKETVAVTMCSPEDLKTQGFAESRCAAKLRKTLFVPYLWDDDGTLTFFSPFLFTDTHTLFSKLEQDYALLQENARNGVMTGSLGVYLQTRTKGAGGGAPKTRAFYLRPQFTLALFGEFKAPAAAPHE